MPETVEFHAKELLKARHYGEAQEHMMQLYQARTPEAIDALIEGLANKDLSVNDGISRRLLESASDAVPNLVKGLKHKNLRVALDCAGILGHIGDKEALVPLMILAGNKELELNKTIKQAIKSIQEANDG